MTNYLKTVRKVDTYIPARENMTVYQDAVKLATSNGKWQKHPNQERLHLRSRNASISTRLIFRLPSRPAAIFCVCIPGKNRPM